MILVTHVLIALASVIYTTFLVVKPSSLKVKISYSLVAATLVSGTYLVLSTSADMLRACVSGLAYTTIVSFGILLAQRKLAKSNVKN